jgi:hypothetical protein
MRVAYYCCNHAWCGAVYSRPLGLGRMHWCPWCGKSHGRGTFFRVASSDEWLAMTEYCGSAAKWRGLIYQDEEARLQGAFAAHGVIE